MPTCKWTIAFVCKRQPTAPQAQSVLPRNPSDPLWGPSLPIPSILSMDWETTADSNLFVVSGFSRQTGPEIIGMLGSLCSHTTYAVVVTADMTVQNRGRSTKTFISIQKADRRS